MMPRRTALVVALGLWVPASACTRVSDRQRFNGNPDTLEIVRTIPEAGALVEPDVQVRLCFNRIIDPASLTDVDAVMASGNSVTDTALRLELMPWTAPDGTDPDPASTAPWCNGSVVTVTPREALIGGVRYRMRFDDTVTGWRGERADVEGEGWLFNDAGTDASFFIEFDVDDTPSAPRDPVPEPEPMSLAALFEPGAVFDTERTTCSCHRDEDDVASALLDLRDPTSAFEDLVFESRLQETGYPMVTPRRPSESFLIQKLVRVDGDALEGVHGAAMPLGEDPLPYADFAMIARWIDEGAAP
ncbi:MAG: Ig-like domain-containing protein [Myxococcota bacterium]